MKLFNNIKLSSTLQTIFLAVTSSAVIFGLLAAVGKKMNTDTENVSVEIAFTENIHTMITEGEVRSYIKKEYPTSLNTSKIEKLELRKIEEVLLKHPQIHNADIFINARNTLEIIIYQKEPIFRLFSAEGESFYLGRRGEAIPLSDHFTARIPVVHLAMRKSDMNEELMEKIKHSLIELNKEIKKNEFLDKLVDQVIIDANLSMEIIPTVGDFKIKVGTTKDLRSKLERLQKLYKKELIYKGWDKYSTIDLRFKDQIVAQKKHE